MPALVKVCRDCGEEYRLEALRCADCGGTLEERPLDEAGETAEVEEAEPAPVDTRDHRAIFVTPRAADLVPLVEALRESGVPHRLAEQSARSEGAVARYALLVPDGRAADALRTLAPLLAPHEQVEHIEGVEARFESDRGYAHCPACGAAQPEAAIECAECGLSLGEAGEGGGGEPEGSMP